MHFADIFRVLVSPAYKSTSLFGCSWWRCLYCGLIPHWGINDYTAGLIQAPDTDTPGSLEIQDLDDDTDLAACLQHVAEADSSVGELDVVQLDAGLRFPIEQTRASEQLDSQLSSVDESRRERFCHRDKMMMEALPPTQGAWVMGWTLDKHSKAWLPFWSLLSSEACSQLVKCACKGARGCGTDVVAGKVDGSAQGGASAAVTIE